MLRSAHHLPTIAHKIISLKTLHGLTRMPVQIRQQSNPIFSLRILQALQNVLFFPLLFYQLLNLVYHLRSHTHPIRIFICSDSFLIKSPHTNTLLNQCAQPVHGTDPPFPCEATLRLKTPLFVSFQLAHRQACTSWLAKPIQCSTSASTLLQIHWPFHRRGCNLLLSLAKLSICSKPGASKRMTLATAYVRLSSHRISLTL